MASSTARIVHFFRIGAMPDANNYVHDDATMPDANNYVQVNNLMGRLQSNTSYIDAVIETPHQRYFWSRIDSILLCQEFRLGLLQSEPRSAFEI